MLREDGRVVTFGDAPNLGDSGGRVFGRAVGIAGKLKPFSEAVEVRRSVGASGRAGRVPRGRRARASRRRRDCCRTPTARRRRRRTGSAVVPPSRDHGSSRRAAARCSCRRSSTSRLVHRTGASRPARRRPRPRYTSSDADTITTSCPSRRCHASAVARLGRDRRRASSPPKARAPGRDLGVSAAGQTLVVSTRSLATSRSPRPRPRRAEAARSRLRARA